MPSSHAGLRFFLSFDKLRAAGMAAGQLVCLVCREAYGCQQLELGREEAISHSVVAG